MEFWQIAEFWFGAAAGIAITTLFWAWSSWIYAHGRRRGAGEAQEPEVIKPE